MRNPVRAVAAAATTAGLVLLAGPAFAHVTVNPGEAAPGSYTKLTFRVPTESDTASTTRVQVMLPAQLTSARVKPHAGWTYALSRSGDAVTAITWTADEDAAIRPGEFDEFDISVGPLPTTDSLTFKALQTYSDGSVVRWIEVPQTGQPEPEHPAPVLSLTAARDDAARTSTDVPAGASGASGDSGDSGASKAPLILSIVALVVAVAGAGVAVVRRRA
ncbi:YcnI family protein [Nocardioides sp. CER19]|uniref:YcnI family copper-binding membrane protein n=1 Tax=Nocardioides sp. CER19 TaxID=3038538 RepID=UPI00244C7089|nr:YcnI family protein [Nocardioides sp. CER19]MDH2416250.1 YcnI family protein [Nocardioides sp. CER19]